MSTTIRLVCFAGGSPGGASSIKGGSVAKVLQKVFDRLHDRVAGLDVHKAQVTAAVRVPAPDGGRLLEVTEFKTTVTGLLALRDWLCAHGVTYVAMEATGVYWKPIVRHEALFGRVG